MTDLLDLRDERPRPGKGKRGRGKVLAVLLLLLLLAGLVAGAVLAGEKVLDRLRGSSAADFDGEGSGEALVQIQSGDTAGDVADTLVAEGVVASRQAFFEVAANDPRATALQPGFYQLRLKMSAAAAFELLLDPASKVVGRVTVPEGRNVEQTLEILAKATEIPLAQYQAAAKDPSKLGLPPYAKNRLEGFLFPATYEVEPGSTAPQVLTMMVDRFEQAADTVGLEEGAARLDLDPYDVVIVASLIEREVKFDDEYGKVARVVYNRLDQGIPLGIDAAVAFGVGKNAGEPLTKSDLAKDTPYENRRQTGLPPTPIASPGEATLMGALNPDDSDILYYVLETKEGRSFFTNDYNAFLRQRDKSRAEGVF
ncbi:MAG: putative periplasmic solute-binding protein [Frankiales bacterium]|nr:putative periplasmic solute-binding protein [Frankiales bacterium]